ncbi:DUF3349 domain-containing protein [Rhodococcus sp. H36-A4]|uniref:DUF3349 domain-containing protein n=1 Tax=unclassified Rhodococcus (in: high G+C Gram-positive bacteria) TaxID=192944 RepID=UPI0016493C41|nr:MULTISPECIES: DUF3349 domain-containing protein [unclassified Rhodococcus (in: high G+C Gram-positive bacteria)]MCZ4079317.1 DUF3349 domain-containing protein [Rhodococcus sp. H36-A4]
MTDPKTTFPASVLQWLRAGYPEGIPPKDRFPLVALLRRAELTDAQVHEVVLGLVAPIGGALSAGAISNDEISEFIKELIDTEPTPEDIARVSARLAAGGWPLADPVSLK